MFSWDLTTEATEWRCEGRFFRGVGWSSALESLQSVFLEVSRNGDLPKWMAYLLEIPMKTDDIWGSPRKSPWKAL